MRTPIIAGNWKMNTTLTEAVELTRKMFEGLDSIPWVEKVICPPFISLAALKDIVKGTSIRVGAQNLFWEDKGAYTGEVSPLMLAPLCEYVIIGHSERRQYFGETNETVNKKIKAALKAGLKPIMCVGERLEENEAGKTASVIRDQVTGGLQGIPISGIFVVAYEPVWAIGTGRAATGEQANETMRLIRDTVRSMYGGEVAEAMRIQYGGSVTAENIAEFIKQPDIDGALVGGASLKPDQFIRIVRQTSEIRGKAAQF